MARMKRVILIVMDSVGIGRAHDGEYFGDSGANTLQHIAQWAKDKHIGHALPNLAKLGLSRLVPEYATEEKFIGSSARMVEISAGKDTTTGHWEIAGTPLTEPFAFFPQGFPSAFVQQLMERASIPGILGNCAGSGTEIIAEFGEEHRKTGKPIVYTSSDSVLQIAAHEETFGLERLLNVCRVARELTFPMRIGRVIARPFVGKKNNFKRTQHRRDFSLDPPQPNLLDLVSPHAPVIAIGKIDDIFCRRSIHYSNHTGNNQTSGVALLKILDIGEISPAFVFANFIDFDQEWGHRRDPGGYLKCLQQFDNYLGLLLRKLTTDDLLLLTADHGNDPTFRGSDHTRENVPLLIYSPHPEFLSTNLGEVTGFFHVARLVLESLGLQSEISKLPALLPSESFTKRLWRSP